jgi:hypothetical protein
MIGNGKSIAVNVDTHEINGVVLLNSHLQGSIGAQGRLNWRRPLIRVDRRVGSSTIGHFGILQLSGTLLAFHSSLVGSGVSFIRLFYPRAARPYKPADPAVCLPENRMNISR